MTLHVIGAGLAGLAAAIAAADGGMEVVLHEATGHAGGRCRSWFEASLGAVIDNGSHLVVGGNHAVFRHLARIGTTDTLVPGPGAFPMIDLDSGEHWTASRLGLLPSVLASAPRLAFGADTNLARRLGRSRHYRRFWEPLALAIMNTPADAASAQVFRRVLARTLWRGHAASQAFMVRTGLSETFVTPALAALDPARVHLRLHHPLRRLIIDAARLRALVFDDTTIQLSRHDRVILAVPWGAAATLLPELPALPSSPIVNVHFRVEDFLADRLTQSPLGLLGGNAQWLFARGNLLSATVSAAQALVARPIEDVAGRIWNDCARALKIKGSPLAARVIKEKRATLFHSPDVERRRPQPRLRENLILAGDWTATGLPCTIEGALGSGEQAARECLR